MQNLDRRVLRLLDRGQSLGLTVKCIRSLLGEQSEMRVVWSLRRLQKRGKVDKNGRRLWRLAVYGGT